eukprot:CAMPEP_0172554680 /NCGR_PEP_ID=MMETSP1067-20121228/55866_1 /TAXON_ID=265564 ORGANISM="Thalassiosira punctigera, Strain Tpunct2005C2" /NCGR_SAMPLE_ID=MMETSP1067 /ASSEMBLY_ACC=CAM_ASM_000444 /LENGTH=743 /DNA_ID=CAMNT_0013343097 /DNA_START=257 /DNA_END=2488 /DNA_ORIENTATION=+
MTNRYDDLERKFGISAYCSPHEGFAAVVKARYSDFLVHEVDLNGNIARLESLETPLCNDSKVEVSAEANTNANAAENTRKRKKIDSADDPIPDSDNKCSNSGSGGSEAQTAPSTDWDNRNQDLSKLIGDNPAEELVLFLKQHEADDKGNIAAGNNVQKFYTLPIITDKQIRRSIHFLIKSGAFSSMARADNHEGRIRVWHRRFESDMPKDTFSGGRGGGNNNSKRKQNGGKRGGSNRAPWPTDRPDYLRFVLYKENIDTTTAAKDIVKMARLNPKRGISYAGMKDKRGITAQFCSVYRMEKEQLLVVNARSTNGNGAAEDAAGGGNTSTKGASVIRLGNFAYSSEEVRLGTLKGNRFDIVLRNIDVLGDADSGARKQLVQQKLEIAGKALKAHGFINYFGMQRFGRSHDTHEVGIAILRGDVEGAIGIIMREKTDESPRIAEARQRWARRFESIDIAKDERAAREAEANCARAIQRDMGRFMVCEKSIVNTLSRKPRDYKRAFGSIAKNMRSMFLHAYQSYLWNKVASHRIETGGSTEVRVGDLVLVGDKPFAKGGSGTSGLKGKSVKRLEEQDVKEGNYSITDVVLPLAGSKIRYPGGSTGEFFDELMKKDGIQKDSFARIGSIDREIALGGDYRKLVCKPSDVTWESFQYNDPVQPLLQTDLMKANGINITANVLSESTTPEKSDSDTLFGMVIGFSLPPSAYATIALRELTKRPTSSEYQSKLELSGKCERNIYGSDNAS